MATSFKFFILYFFKLNVFAVNEKRNRKNKILCKTNGFFIWAFDPVSLIDDGQLASDDINKSINEILMVIIWIIITDRSLRGT